MNRKAVLIAACTLAAVLAACSTDSTGRVTLALSSMRAASPAASAGFTPAGTPSVVTAGDSTVIALGNDTIILRSVEVVLREVELKRIEAAECDSVEANDDCEEFETGAMLATLPLGNTATETVVSVNAPAGMYDKLQFEIHKAEASEVPGFDGVSIRVTGTFSHGGTRSDFTYTSDLNAEQEIELSPPLTVSDGQAASVTLRIDVANWFLDAGGTLVDPASANKGQPNESVVRDRIEASLDAFRDDDHDGHDDDSEHS